MTKIKTKYFKFRGKASWARVYEPDEYLNQKNFKINLHPSGDTIDEIKDAGIQLREKNKPVDNVDGTFFTFKRPYVKQFQSGLTYFCPPEILYRGESRVWYEVDGQKVRTYSEGETPVRKGEPILIGNDSTVEIEVEVYPTKSFGNGNRLVSVNILDLIEYDPDAEEEVEEDEEEAPKPSPKPSKKSDKKVPW